MGKLRKGRSGHGGHGRPHSATAGTKAKAPSETSTISIAPIQLKSSSPSNSPIGPTRVSALADFANDSTDTLLEPSTSSYNGTHSALPSSSSQRSLRSVSSSASITPRPATPAVAISFPSSEVTPVSASPRSSSSGSPPGQTPASALSLLRTRLVSDEAQRQALASTSILADDPPNKLRKKKPISDVDSNGSIRRSSSASIASTRSEDPVIPQDAIEDLVEGIIVVEPEVRQDIKPIQPEIPVEESKTVNPSASLIKRAARFPFLFAKSSLSFGIDKTQAMASNIPLINRYVSSPEQQTPLRSACTSKAEGMADHQQMKDEDADSTVVLQKNSLRSNASDLAWQATELGLAVSLAGVLVAGAGVSMAWNKLSWRGKSAHSRGK